MRSRSSGSSLRRSQSRAKGQGNQDNPGASRGAGSASAARKNGRQGAGRPGAARGSCQGCGQARRRQSKLASLRRSRRRKPTGTAVAKATAPTKVAPAKLTPAKIAAKPVVKPAPKVAAKPRQAPPSRWDESRRPSPSPAHRRPMVGRRQSRPDRRPNPPPDRSPRRPPSRSPSASNACLPCDSRATGADTRARTCFTRPGGAQGRPAAAALLVSLAPAREGRPRGV